MWQSPLYTISVLNANPCMKNRPSLIWLGPGLKDAIGIILADVQLFRVLFSYSVAEVLWIFVHDQISRSGYAFTCIALPDHALVIAVVRIQPS